MGEVGGVGLGVHLPLITLIVSTHHVFYQIGKMIIFNTVQFLHVV